jgi:hypothetical protein
MNKPKNPSKVTSLTGVTLSITIHDIHRAGFCLVLSLRRAKPARVITANSQTHRDIISAISLHQRVMRQDIADH